MANTTYTVDIDVLVNADDSVKKLKTLKSELRKVGAGTEEFKKLSQAIKDTEDSLEEARAGAKGLVDSLEDAPGPIGQLFQGIRKLEIATKSFGTAFKAIGIGLLVSAIAGLAAAFSQSEDAAKKLQPILIGFQKIFNGIFRAIEPVFNSLIALATNAMPFVTKAFGVAYSAITSFLQGLGKLGSAVGKLIKGDFTGAWEDAKSSVADFGKRYDEANKAFVAGTQEVTKIEKEELEKRKKEQEEAAKKRKEAADKEAERLKKEAEERKKILDEANKAELDSFKETLSDRERELYDAGLVLNERLSAIDKAGTGDRELIQEAYRKKVKEINEKYDNEEKEKADKKKEEELKKAEEAAKFQLEQYDKIKKLEQERAEATFAANQAIAQSWVDLGQNIAGIFGSLINVFEQGSNAAKAFGIAQVAINAASSIGQILVNSKSAGFEFDKSAAVGKATILSGVGKLFNPFTAAIGAAEIKAGNAVIAGSVAGKAALKAKTGLQIAAVGVSSAAQIAAILSAKKSSTSTGGGGQGGGGEAGGVATPTFSGVPSIQAPQIQTTGGESPTARLAETITSAQRPVRAYVVSGEVSSQQALDRRTSRAATFSGG